MASHSAGMEDAGDDDDVRHHPAFWAKLGHHPYWPAKWASKDERLRYAQHQRKPTHKCVKFYGSHDIGWVAPSAVVPFEDGLRKQLHSVAKVNKNVKFLAGLDEARRSMDEYRNGGAKASYAYGPGLFSSGGGASLQSLLDASSPNGGSYSRHLGSEKCLLCNRPRDEEVFLCCRKCGSSYHGRCVQADEAVEPLCGICGETLTPAAGPPLLPADVAKVEGPERGSSGEEAGHKHRHSEGGGGGEKKRRASTSQHDRRARWESGGEWEGGMASDSEDSCFICKEPGMLITCDGPSCRKAFHKPCLAYSAWAQDFVCPRHKCVVCNASDVDLAKARDAAIASPSSSPSAPLPAAKLWRCSTCPVSYCPTHLPAGYNEANAPPPPVTTKSGRIITTLHKPPVVHEEVGPQCFHCKHPSPRIRLAKIIERSWARLACNYLSLPFMRPFLHGAPPPPSLSQAPRLDMVALILKARALQYDSVDDYLADVRTLVTQTKAYCAGHDEAGPLLEAIETLAGNAKRFLDSVRKEVRSAEGLLDEEERQASTEAKKPEESHPPFGAATWREECKQPVEEGLPIEYCPCKTLAEWAEYVQRAPLMYAETQRVIENPDERERNDRAEIEKGLVAQVIATLRYDDRIPMTSLRQHNDLELQLEEQSSLLRRCLEGHALLRKKLADEKAWAVRYKLPKPGKRRRTPDQAHAPPSTGGAGGSSSSHAEGLVNGDAKVEGGEGPQGSGGLGKEKDAMNVSSDDESCDDDPFNDRVVTIGDMHVVKELQLSNANLRKRLECKAEILRQREAQLTAAKKIYRELEHRNTDLQMRVRELEARLEKEQQQRKQQHTEAEREHGEEEEEEEEEGKEQAPEEEEEEAAASTASPAAMDES